MDQKDDPARYSRRLSVGCHEPTLRVRLSKQAREFLTFLNDNGIDGTSYKEQEGSKLLSIDQMIADRSSLAHHYPEAMRMWGTFKQKGISVINYIEITKKSGVRISSTGASDVENRSVHHSIERTVKTLWRKGAVARFKDYRMFYYCITPLGRELLKRREVGS